MGEVIHGSQKTTDRKIPEGFNFIFVQKIV